MRLAPDSTLGSEVACMTAGQREKENLAEDTVTASGQRPASVVVPRHGELFFPAVVFWSVALIRVVGAVWLERFDAEPIVAATLPWLFRTHLAFYARRFGVTLASFVKWRR